MYTVHCTLYSTVPVQCTVYIVQCILYIVWRIFNANSLWRTMYSVHCTLYTIRRTVYARRTSIFNWVWHTLYTVQCTVYGVQYTVYDVRRICISNQLHFIVHTFYIHYTVYAVYYTLYSEHCTSYYTDICIYICIPQYTLYTDEHIYWIRPNRYIVPRTLYVHCTSYSVPRKVYKCITYTCRIVNTSYIIPLN